MTSRATFSEAVDRLETPAAAAATGGGLDVDIIVPVYNEQRILADSIARLHAFVSDELPFSWRIVVADNASTDDTPRIAQRLSRTLPGVRALRLEQSGRGRALRAAWSRSPARVVCYMDVDLSTDLHALLPLLAPLLSGHSDVAIGTRLARGARVTRGVKRELISRSYNRVLHLALRAKFSDAQCGFKAIRGDVLPGLLTEIRDEGWFFDTELLILAQRHGLRIHEVPVDWVDDPDSRVDILATVAADMRGVARLQAASPVLRFLGIGIVSTVAYALLFLLLAGLLPSALGSGLALGVTAIANTAANRRWTFALRGREQRTRQYAAGAVVFALTLALTDGALALLHATDPGTPRALELGVLVIASLVATVTRYIALRSWVFAARPPGPKSPVKRALDPSRH
jgi:glycosyltransferase involved in cell wall biosynthesis